MSDAQYQEGGGDLPAYQEDFFQRIVNVSWAGKLAVELPKNTYLQANSPVSMGKVVISVWFRVPDAIMQAAFNAWNVNTGSDSTLAGIVPILTWGPPEDGHQDNFDTFGNPTTSFDFTAGPSFIGAYLGGQSSYGQYPANLAIRFQSQNSSTLTTISGHGTILSRRTEGNFYAIGPQDAIHEYASSLAPLVTIDVSPDRWHHLLLSYNALGATGQMWLALDDKNYAASSFWPAAPINMGGFGVSGGPNDIAATYDWPIYKLPPGSGGQGSFATSGGFNMPNSPDIAVPIRSNLTQYAQQPIEMAELQIFTGMILDTNNVSDRRMFIDSKGKPVSPAQTQKLIGSKPAVLLHTLPKWQKGTNTGTGGHFNVSGKPAKFEPEPQLGK